MKASLCGSLAFITIVTVMGCSAQKSVDESPSQAASESIPLTSAPSTVDLLTPDPRPQSEECAEYGQKLERAQRRLAKLEEDGPPPPVDGYDFGEDWAQDVFIAEQEVEFYLGMLNDACASKAREYWPDEETYTPEYLDPQDLEEPDFGED